MAASSEKGSESAKKGEHITMFHIAFVLFDVRLSGPDLVRRMWVNDFAKNITRLPL